MLEKPYQPSPEEFSDAESRLAPEQKKETIRREKFYIQERNSFADFNAQIDQNSERRKPTPEEKERMDNQLQTLGKIFEGADFNWLLDGALNVSLRQPEYIGIHKDVDISLLESDLEKAEDFLGQRGYGLFVSYSEDQSNRESKMFMQRVSPGTYVPSGNKHLMIEPIDKSGEIRSGESLAGIDLHLINIDKDGEAVDENGAMIPKDWLKHEEVSFKDTKINLSDPRRTIYYKLHGDRAYDQTDMEKLVGHGSISIDQLNDIDEALNHEMSIYHQRIQDMVIGWAKQMKPGMTAEEIFNQLAKDHRLANQLAEKWQTWRDLTKDLSESDVTNPKSFLILILKHFDPDANHRIYKVKLDGLIKIAGEKEKESR